MTFVGEGDEEVSCAERRIRLAGSAGPDGVGMRESARWRSGRHRWSRRRSSDSRAIRSSTRCSAAARAASRSGMDLDGGPLSYASTRPPAPLTLDEQAALAFAACGITGHALAELPYDDGEAPETGGGRIMMNLVGRTAASGDASHADTVFVIDDDGVWMLRRPQDYPRTAGARAGRARARPEADRAVRGGARPHRRRARPRPERRAVHPARSTSGRRTSPERPTSCRSRSSPPSTSTSSSSSSARTSRSSSSTSGTGSGRPGSGASPAPRAGIWSTTRTSAG